MRAGPLAGILASSSLLILTFPGPDMGWLAPVALVPLLFSVRRLTAGAAFFYGWFAGFIWFFVSLNWISQTLSRYGGIPFPFNQLAIVVLGAILAVYPGVFTAVVPLVKKAGGPWPAIILPSVWVLTEAARSRFPAPFPWLILGSGFWKTSPVLPLYGLVGVFGVSFLCILVSVLLLEIVESVVEGNRRGFLTRAGVLLVLATSVFSLGHFSGDEGAQREITVSVVQGDFPQEIKWEKSMREETLNTYIGLSRGADLKGSDLIVWPEAAVPFYYQTEQEFADRIRDFTRKEKVHLVFGSPAFGVRGGELVYFNRAYHVGPDGDEEWYDKVRLVPFGEYIPFHRVLGFLEKMVPGSGEFMPGRMKGPFSTPVPAGTLICFESTFPDLAREQVRRGAEILLNLTNDAWFGKSWGPHQHLAASAVRAAENGVPLIRAANTGISAIFDRRGHMVKSLGLFRRGTITATLETGGKRTFYCRVGDLIVYISAFVIILAISRKLFGIRRKPWKIWKDSNSP